ncbi:MAG: EscU/YscU/HrcU family type III secretion system export apparatus switch protein [Candidatus Kapabacteria bacterium]|nr:EscU/YscU/HrcU family type III secretion system export apparatus switch protein [Candidatus Kapabacteria bacterium]
METNESEANQSNSPATTSTTNRTTFIKEAIALAYHPDGHSAPVVVAKGSGSMAEQIMKLADEYNVPLMNNPDLIQELTTLDVLDEIPEELYKAVAEVLAFIYKLDEQSKLQSKEGQ